MGQDPSRLANTSQLSKTSNMRPSRSKSCPPAAGDMLSESQSAFPRFSTFCQALDELIVAVSPHAFGPTSSPRKGKSKETWALDQA